MINESLCIRNKSPGIDHFEMNVDLITRRIFEHMLDPRWQFVYGLCYTAILHLFQTFTFQRKLPNLLTVITVILINKGLILPELAVNEQTIQAHVLRDQFYLDTTNASTDVNMPQPKQLTCLWNKNGVLEYSQF